MPGYVEKVDCHDIRLNRWRPRSAGRQRTSTMGTATNIIATTVSQLRFRFKRGDETHGYHASFSVLREYPGVTSAKYQTEYLAFQGLVRLAAATNCAISYILFERSEFLIDTSQKKGLRVCPCARVHVCSTNNLGFSEWYYVPHTYVPGISSLSAGYQDTYM